MAPRKTRNNNNTSSSNNNPPAHSTRSTRSNSTRPATPQDNPASAAATVPSSQVSEAATRPTKQRKTGRNARAAVNAPADEEEPERLRERKTSRSKTTTRNNNKNNNNTATATGANNEAVNMTETLPSSSSSSRTGIGMGPDKPGLAGSSSIAPANTKPHPWAEPDPVRTEATWKEMGLPEANILKSMEPLGVDPSNRLRRQLGVPVPGDPPRPNNRRGARTTSGVSTPVTTAGTENHNRPMTAESSVTEETALSDSRSMAATPAMGNGNANANSNANNTSTTHTSNTRRAETEPRSTRSRAGNVANDNTTTTATRVAPGSSSSAFAIGPEPTSTPAVNGYGPAASSSSSTRPPPSLKHFSREKLIDALEKSIVLAESLGNDKVSRSLRVILDKGRDDPFFLSTVEEVLDRETNSEAKPLFQTMVRNALRQTRAPKEREDTRAAEMTRTQSATSSASSLSTAKSLDAETFPPAASSADTNPQPTGIGQRKGRGKPRAAATGSTSPLFPPFPGLKLRRREYDEAPEYSDEALAAKKDAFGTEVTPGEAATLAPSSIRVNGTGSTRPTRATSRVPPPSSPPPPAPRQYRARVRTRADVAEEDSRANSSVVEGPPSKKQKLDGSVPKRVPKIALTQEEVDKIDNIDVCRSCNGSGSLLCCDGCIDSYHFDCLDPPLDPANPPEGQWFCPTCQDEGPMGALIDHIPEVPPRDFQLPRNIRDYYEGVATAADGRHVVTSTIKRAPNTRAPRTNPKTFNDPYWYRTTDSKGNLIICTRCSRTSNHRPIIQCSFCPCNWHLDCLDPPLSNVPVYVPGSDKPHHQWKCPNHIDHDLAVPDGYGGYRKFRRPRHPIYMDVDVLPSEDEEPVMRDEYMLGKRYRVTEKGLMTSFINKVKQDRYEDLALRDYYARQLKKKVAEQTTAEAAYTGAQTPVYNALASLEPNERQAIMTLLSLRTDDVNTSTSTPAPAVNNDAITNGNTTTNHFTNTNTADKPTSSKIDELVENLLHDVPDEVREAENEYDILKALQEKLSQRMRALKGKGRAAVEDEGKEENEEVVDGEMEIDEEEEEEL
ncbi:hypothetical protein AJ80_02168 [Polytolypa hystricis UAMH7299]|uniref:PHD-type domain-containing protein n=1 Tax=Polytolypa hystricis (strain UAMH7299) TaxID=1447883 RepID=A0A2B7YRS0_POLH7|nr:hypothetical protein AJ80_02168 [Polytolypa hystricis UAMH7299]